MNARIVRDLNVSWSGWFIRPRFFHRLDLADWHLRDIGPVRLTWRSR